LPKVIRHEPAGVTAVTPLVKSTAGGSGSFLALADDGSRYWCKTLNNCQHERVPTNEQVVARLGLLIGAPVCWPELVRIPAALVGWEFRPGRVLEEGWAHGSLAVQPAVEAHDLMNRALDDNARRHAGVYALFDWLGGSDPQWLTVGTDLEYHSHDHGHYFPGGPAWTTGSLQQEAATPFVLGQPTTGLDASELERLAVAVEAVSEEEVLSVMAKVPADWPVTDEELEALADFVLDRRSSVAGRLRSYV
jgi:hypothetical protein